MKAIEGLALLVGPPEVKIHRTRLINPHIPPTIAPIIVHLSMTIIDLCFTGILFSKTVSSDLVFISPSPLKNSISFQYPLPHALGHAATSAACAHLYSVNAAAPTVATQMPASSIDIQRRVIQFQPLPVLFEKKIRNAFKFCKNIV